MQAKEKLGLAELERLVANRDQQHEELLDAGFEIVDGAPLYAAKTLALMLDEVSRKCEVLTDSYSLVSTFEMAEGPEVLSGELGRAVGWEVRAREEQEELAAKLDSVLEKALQLPGPVLGGQRAVSRRGEQPTFFCGGGLSPSS